MAVPSDLSGLRIWLRADDITGLVDGDPIASWSDTSGNSFTFGQATSAKRPLYKTSIVNGHAVARFDGVDDVLTATAWTSIFNTTGGGIYTIMAAVIVTSAATGAAATFDDACVLTDAGGNAGFAHVRDVSGALTVRAYNWDGNEDFAALTGVGYGAVKQIAQDHDNTTLRIERDNGSFTTTASGTPATSGATNLGSNYAGAKFIAADLPEIIAYNRVLTTTERGDMHDYFTSRYVAGADNTTKPGVAGMFDPHLIPAGWF